MDSNVDLCAIPLGKAPDGTWDLVHFESLTALSIGLCTVLAFLATTVAAVRVFVNRHQLLMADYFTILGVLFSIAHLVLTAYMSPFYRHDWNIPLCWLNASFAKQQFCLVLFSGFSQFFPRAAIFLLYRQLFQVHNRSVHIAIWIGLIATFVINFPNIPIALAIQIPRSGESWMDALARLNSHSSNGFGSGRQWGPIQGAASIVLDFYAFILPLPIIARLNLNRRKRTQLLLLFSTALLGVAASIIALVYKIKLFIIETRGGQNGLFSLGAVNICIDIEGNVALVVGCMPAFAAFMRIHVVDSRAFQSLRSTFGGSNPAGHGTSTSGPQRPLQGTIGSPAVRKNPNAMYYELTDTNNLASRCTIDGGKGSTTTTMESAPSGILKTMDFTQESRSQTQSMDELVQ